MIHSYVWCLLDCGKSAICNIWFRLIGFALYNEPLKKTQNRDAIYITFDYTYLFSFIGLLHNEFLRIIELKHIKTIDVWLIRTNQQRNVWLSCDYSIISKDHHIELEGSQNEAYFQFLLRWDFFENGIVIRKKDKLRKKYKN